MNVCEPIKNVESLKKFKGYYIDIEFKPRNYLLIVIGINTALRISDILELKWKDVYNSKCSTFNLHVTIIEKKTKKRKCVYLNQSIVEALETYKYYYPDIKDNDYLFAHSNNKALSISRMQAHRIIKKAADYYGIEGIISCHSMRKTFGYQARKNGVDSALLVDIFNHSSYAVTRRYLGIAQEDLDEVYSTVQL